MAGLQQQGQQLLAELVATDGAVAQAEVSDYM